MPALIVLIATRAATPFSTFRYRFGSVNAAQTAPIVHVFTVTNPSSAAVIIERLQPTCGCTSAVVGDDPKTDPILTKPGALPGTLSEPITIPAGGSVNVRVSIDPSRLSPGSTDKFVEVFVQGQNAPYAILEMTGTVIAGATYDPPTLDFGKVPYGKGAELPLTVVIDPYLTDPARQAEVVCTQSGVVVKETDPARPKPAADGTVVEHYTVRVLPIARLGTFTGVVTMLASDGRGGKRQVSNPDPLSGSVVGNVTANPSVVAFAMATQGQPLTQEVDLAGAAASDIPKMKLLVAGDMLAAKLEAGALAGGKVGDGPNVRLLVTLTSKAHAGSLSSEIIVTMADGAQLLLPVTAYIVAK